MRRAGDDRTCPKVAAPSFVGLGGQTVARDLMPLRRLADLVIPASRDRSPQTEHGHGHGHGHEHEHGHGHGHEHEHGIAGPPAPAPAPTAASVGRLSLPDPHSPGLVLWSPPMTRMAPLKLVLGSIAVVATVVAVSMSAGAPCADAADGPARPPAN